jgi:hypothetical protein
MVIYLNLKQRSLKINDECASLSASSSYFGLSRFFLFWSIKPSSSTSPSNQNLAMSNKEQDELLKKSKADVKVNALQMKKALVRQITQNDHVTHS